MIRHRLRFGIGLFLVLLCPVVVLGSLWVWDSNLEAQYETFRKRELQVAPLFDALNDGIAAELPPLPIGASEIRRWSNGIDSPLYEHGRYLYIQVSTTMSNQGIRAYYQQNLVANGWAEDKGDLFDNYFRETSCIQIRPYGQNLHEYDIVIWHDFYSQPFSPPIPDLKYMQTIEMGETNFAVCP